MAEAEDLITDAARHATIFARALWRRHRPASKVPQSLQFADVAQRLDLLIAAVFGHSYALRVAQPGTAPSLIAQLLLRNQLPPGRNAISATDGRSIWLPASFAASEEDTVVIGRFRTMALQQAMRARRGSARHLSVAAPALERELYLLLEARAADDALARLLPGIAAALGTLRREALKSRPRLDAFPAPLKPLEVLARSILADDAGKSFAAALPSLIDRASFALPATAVQVQQQARALSAVLGGAAASALRGPRLLWRDNWTGDLRAPPAGGRTFTGDTEDENGGSDEGGSPRSARLPRRPEVREGDEDGDDAQPGPWMVQSAQPHEQAEDPMGLQRPSDRDETTAAGDFADALSELPEARLVSAPGKPKEVLISDDPPDSRSKREMSSKSGDAPEQMQYPEWDWRLGCYRNPGTTVLLMPALSGPQQWLDDTLAARRGMLHEIRRRFELLRAQRVRLHRQLDGADIDLQAYVDSHADFRAGLPMAQRLYQTERRSRRDMAIMLLVDVSGSTDGWIAADRRIIDVEREALLLVCVALEGMDEPYSVLAFSGEGPQAVVVRSVKRFNERYDNIVARRIAGLEPEHYTRAGAAMRHASTLLMRQPAEHRLLLLLSDGKPNDIDDYDGRYGVEDLRQAVTEAKLQGISPFCLTIDRQAATYLPAVFGPNHYALLPRPELLPSVLLDWLRRLVAA
jgi:nitric oxide reductase NorD protein